ncbi:SGNH/GDSL hydrolase family protein [Bradyrhizobium lablabi]|uniref:SGNH/GDSL hydrolase family protein n=1 Tax=Bradyrhizobium lablabi TaxID=722472 RepID=UPI001BA80ABE|nr:SGNH/GDSL hydrolase family protein [Bradyrhizobium lablabi]MBR1121060.1 SGNH/GDSL hydrolase family protein [Bradyrhizobium lablabi]
MTQAPERGRFRQMSGAIATGLVVTILTLAALEIVLRIADFRELRQGVSERSLSYRYDAELGWTAIPGSASTATNARTVAVRHNSLGLRDEEFAPDGKPTILFLGDSFVWGLDAEPHERFSELLKPRIPSHRILAAGISGYGTDQEYLLLQKLWPQVKPAIVVLVFCTMNDRGDNSTNIRYEGYHKPYFVTAADGSLELKGQPVPLSRLQYINEVWWVRNIWLGRLANAVYLKIRHPKLEVPDPTERLVDSIAEFVSSKGAKFFVGLQATDKELIEHLQARNIPFVNLEGAPFYPGASVGGHWTPEGQKVVADRLFDLLSASKAIPAN